MAEETSALIVDEIRRLGRAIVREGWIIVAAVLLALLLLVYAGSA